MRNFCILFFIALLLIIAACTEKDKIYPTTPDAKEVLSEAYAEYLYLDCISDEPFVVRAEYDDQTKRISFKYYGNSANSSIVIPVSVNWTINNGGTPVSQFGEASSTSFVFNVNHQVDVSIVFDDNTTFQDQFCVNIDPFFPTVFNVCSNHSSIVDCREKGRIDKRAKVIVNVIF